MQVGLSYRDQPGTFYFPLMEARRPVERPPIVHVDNPTVSQFPGSQVAELIGSFTLENISNNAQRFLFMHDQIEDCVAGVVSASASIDGSA